MSWTKRVIEIISSGKTEEEARRIAKRQRERLLFRNKKEDVSKLL